MLYVLAYMFAHYRSRDSSCIDKYPEHFRWREGAAVCVYKHSHLKQLREHHSESRFVEHADFLRAQDFYVYYECEGGLLCRAINAATGWVGFLERYPRSHLRKTALEKIELGFSFILDAPEDLEHQDAYMADDVKALLDRLDVVAKKMTAPDGSALAELTSRVRRSLLSTP